MKILTIIPARGGSKGIKDKNIVDLCGKPLIQYTIDLSLKLIEDEIINKAIVSTDSEKIKKISEDLGAEVPFLRPNDLSGDKAKSVDLIFHAIEFFKMKNLYFDAVMLLQPTQPLRKYEDVIKAIELFESHKNAESLISVYEEDYINEYVMYKIGENNVGIPMNPAHNKGIRRQEHGAIYVRSGDIYLTSVDYLKNTKQIMSDNPLLYVISKKNTFIIDNEEDLEILRRMMCK